MTTLNRGTLYRIEVPSDRGEAKICESSMTGAIHNGVSLDVHQYSGETRVRTTTHSLKVPMNDVAGVEVAETPSDVGQLGMEVSTG